LNIFPLQTSGRNGSTHPLGGRIRDHFRQKQGRPHRTGPRRHSGREGPLAALRVPHQRDDRHQKWPVSAEVMPNNKFLPTLSVLLLGH
jgi:hypothetical protein